MGFLRFLLALSVIVTHSQPIFGITLLPGNLAVEAFFIISGFYMAMVLNEKYFKIKGYYKLFISNRMLRIYPLYWFVLLVIVGFYVVEGLRMGNYHYLQLYATYWHKLNPLTFAYLIISNVIIVGQEFAIFFVVNDNGSLLFNTKSYIYPSALIKFFLDIPLWSVSLELMFYLISPLLVKLKNNNLIIIIGVLLIARLLSKINGVAYDPYIYWLLPYQIVFFLLGIIGYKIYIFLNTIKFSNVISYGLMPYIVLFTVFYGSFAETETIDFIYLASFFIIVPLAFKISKTSKLDRYFGELSYPMYISHAIFLDISLRIVTRYKLDSNFFPIIGAFCTIIFSIFLVKVVSKRIEYYRAKRVQLSMGR